MSNVYYLSHGGPGSGRYPLGSGERPFQKFEGTGKKPSGIVGYIRSRKAKKEEQLQQKKKAEELKIRAEEEQRRKQHAADKERVLRSGTAAEVMKYQGELTNKELQDAYLRIDWEKRLSAFAASDVKSTMDKVDNVMKNVKTGTEWLKIGIDTYNTLAAVYNATPDGKKKPFTFVKKGG